MTELLTVQQVAEQLQISHRTVMRAIQRGGLRAHQVGTRNAWRVRPDDLDEWLDSRANVLRTPTPALDVVPLAVATARPRPNSGRRGGGVLTVTDHMGRAS